MSSTLYQKGCLWVNDYGSFPVEVAKPCYDAGWRVIVGQAQDHGPISAKRAAEWIKLGYLFGIAVRPSNEPLHSGTWTPYETADWTSNELSRLNAELLGEGAQKMTTLVHFNFEDDVETEDQWTNGQWSTDFTRQWRFRRPTRASVLNSYRGAEGMNLSAYAAREFRASWQTYDGNSLWADSPEAFVPRLVERGFKAPYVRPTFAVYEKDGQRPKIADEIAAAHAARCVGITAFYADGAPVSYLEELISKALDAGVARL